MPDGRANYAGLHGEMARDSINAAIQFGIEKERCRQNIEVFALQQVEAAARGLSDTEWKSGEEQAEVEIKIREALAALDMVRLKAKEDI